MLLVVGTAAGAITMAPPPKIEQLAGAWIGPNDQTAYFRMEIDKAGHGLLVIQEDSPDGKFSFYRISKTTLSQYKISFALVPLNRADPTVALSGEASPGELLLVRSGINNGYNWHQNVSLQREDFLLQRILAVQKASAQFHAKAER